MAWENFNKVVDNSNPVRENWIPTDETSSKNLLETLSDDEVRRNREACDKFDWIVTKVVKEDLVLDPHSFNIKWSSHLPGWYPGDENQPHSTLTVTIPGADIYIKKTTEKKDACCNFHVKVVERGNTTFDKEFTEFSSVISILDKISLVLSRNLASWTNRAEELLWEYTGY